MESANSSLLVFLVVLWLSMVVQVDAQDRVDEVQALTSFRGDMEQFNHGNGYWFTWNENDDNACAWAGVTCTQNFTVAVLDLSDWGLTVLYGLSVLSKLPDLLLLDMSSNHLGGDVIPDEISSLTQVTGLDLSRNGFSGSIPANISACRSLRSLSLEQNSLEGPIPDLSEMVHLQFLLLAENNLTGSFPKELGEISSLISIDLSGNQLNGSIPSLVNSTNLVRLKLDSNLFDGFDEPLYLNSPNLQEWDVSNNQLEGIIPLALTNLFQLSVLNMACNRLSGKIPSGFSYGPSGLIHHFDFSQNQLSGSIPVDLLQPPDNVTIFLNVSYNHLNDSIPTSALRVAGVNWLDLSHNQLNGPIPSQLFGFGYLDLGHNLLSGDIVDILVDCQTFRTSYIFELGKFQNHLVPVSYIFLENNLLTGDLSRMYDKWANCILVAVDLSNNNLSWTTTKSISDPLSTALNNFPVTLREFRVGGNDFSGTSLPVGPLSRPQGQPLGLSVLDFSNNKLTGKISGTVFNGTSLSGLRFLNLSNNKATGPVSESIINMISTAVVFDPWTGDTFGNGSIPEHTIAVVWAPGVVFDRWTGATLGNVVDLSNNKLSGPLPVIPLNSSLNDPSLFAGNDGLCGHPLTECPQPGTRLPMWILLTTIGGLVLIAMGSCVVATWQWKVYQKRHEQDADLIQTLMDRDSATLMPLRDLKRATNNFCESARIGEGGFGTVYMGELTNGAKVAIKKSKRDGSEEDKQQVLNEVRILSQVNHRHLVKLLGCCMENKVSLLIFEFVSNGTLQEHLQGKIGDVGLTWKQRLNIAIQTADALNYLHTGTNFPIYHRDVKSANILLNEDLSAKVADFGISKLAPMEATHVSTRGMGTIGYVDPEYYTYHRLTDRSDVYSFGVVLLELISAKKAVFHIDTEPVNLVMFAIPFIESGDMQPLIDQVLLETYNDPSGHGKESIWNVGRLAMQCLAMPSKERPSMNEVWKELQIIWLKHNGTSVTEDLGSMNEDDNIEIPFCNTGGLLSIIFSNQTHSFDMQNNSRSVELSSMRQDLD